jgi:hypothetical protein
MPGGYLRCGMVASRSHRAAPVLSFAVFRCAVASVLERPKHLNTGLSRLPDRDGRVSSSPAWKVVDFARVERHILPEIVFLPLVTGWSGRGSTRL